MGLCIVRRYTVIALDKNWAPWCSLVAQLKSFSFLDVQPSCRVSYSLLPCASLSPKLEVVDGSGRSLGVSKGRENAGDQVMGVEGWLSVFVE